MLQTPAGFRAPPLQAEGGDNDVEESEETVEELPARNTRGKRTPASRTTRRTPVPQSAPPKTTRAASQTVEGTEQVDAEETRTTKRTRARTADGAIGQVPFSVSLWFRSLIAYFRSRDLLEGRPISPQLPSLKRMTTTANPPPPQLPRAPPVARAKPPIPLRHPSPKIRQTRNLHARRVRRLQQRSRPSRLPRAAAHARNPSRSPRTRTRTTTRSTRSRTPRRKSPSRFPLPRVPAASVAAG